jgi:two-component system, NtrC family, sensor histidine kinase KinB
MRSQQRTKSDPAGGGVRRSRAERFATGTTESPRLQPDERGLYEDDVAQIVHDLKGPLSTIALEMYVLDRKLASGAYSDLRSTTARIIRNTEFLDRIVHDLLDSCMAGAGKLEIYRAPTELRGLLEQVIDRIVSTRDRGRVRLEAPCPIVVPIDDCRIERVVANLVGNALKYTPPNAEVVVQLQPGPPAALISVRDNGPGMKPSEMQHIFDKYRRGASSHGRDGCGLGLYVTKLIVEAHGGRLGVESVEGSGSRFYFELPWVSDS